VFSRRRTEYGLGALPWIFSIQRFILGVVEAVAGTQVKLGGLLEAQLDQLANLSEDQLLTIIGVESVTPIESRCAVIYAYASREDVSAFEENGLVSLAPVNLVRRGRRTVDRVMADWSEELRQRVCPALNKKESERGLAANIASVLVSLIPTHLWMLIAAIAMYIAKYLLEKLCEGWVPAT
jgi:hypothetical protein